MFFVDEEESKLANKELIKAKPNEIQENVANTLALYLNNINSSMAIVIRLKLPIPFKIQNKTEIRPPDLLKWTHIDNSKVFGFGFDVVELFLIIEERSLNSSNRR